MMPSFMGASLPCVPPVEYTHDALLEDLSRQMAMSASRRQSRGSSGALSGNAMRVVKPSSASNSPRNNLMQQRRRTIMNDPVFAQRAQQILEQQQPYLPTPGPDMCSNNCYEPVKRAARPVSWHPSTQMPQQQQQQQQQQFACVPTQMPQQFPFPNYCDWDLYAPAAQMPPTPAAYSAYSSPASTFSPMQLPAYSTYELPQTYSSPCWNVSAAPPMEQDMPQLDHIQQTPAFTTTTTTAPSYTPAYAPSQLEESSYSPVSWSNIPCASYSRNVTAPPTPEDPPKAHQPAPVVVKQEPLPYSPPALQDEEEEEGDILIGLGLYDPPEKLGFLGASFEPTGKGLKLEDAWEPPATEDDEDEDDEKEGEGDAESEEE